MSLNKLALFKNVKITPDYSVVHDMDSDTWKDYLLGQLDPMPADSSPPENVYYDERVNYYRMPETIRIEANYDIIRTATYGYLEDGLSEGNEGVNVSFRRIFFWVKDVRILKQFSNRDLTSTPVEYKDVLELDIDIDVWSSYGGQFELYDSYVERRHMPRWKKKTVSGVTTYEPIYYPNAAQGIEGAYQEESSEDLTGNVELPGYTGTFNPQFIIVTAVDKKGNTLVYIGMNVNHSVEGVVPVHIDSNIGSRTLFDIQSIMSGGNNLYGEVGSSTFGITSDFVQSISVVPFMPRLKDIVRLGMSGGTFFVYIDTSDTVFSSYFNVVSPQGGQYSYITIKPDGELQSLMMTGYFTPDVIAPDHNAPSYGEYIDKHEPMMYLSPARVRKVTSAFGGEVYEVPDIAAFKETFGIQNLLDFNGTVTYVFTGNTIAEGNILGACGVLEAATLPIYNSAWKSYEAISKISDNMVFNAKQLQSVASGIGNTAMQSVVGAFMGGGPAGAVLGVASGILGTASNLYGNDVELEAKRIQIRNSPCNIKSGGSGLGAYLCDYLDVLYVTLKLDDVSMEKLRFMYYYYGYHVNRMFRGDIELHTRKVFDFIKTSGAKVRGSITADAARKLAAIFDKGVTIYHGTSGYMEIGAASMFENDEVNE